MIMNQAKSIFERFPQLNNLRGRVPDEIIEKEVSEKIDGFELHSAQARKLIPTVRLHQIFPAELEGGRIILERFLGQWGNISVEELCKICLISKWLRPELIVEFGTYNGMTTLQLAQNTPDSCQIVTVDIDPDSTDAASLRIGDIDGFLARKAGTFRVPVGEYFRNYPVRSRIQQLLGDSTKLNFEPWYGQANLVFIDAGHTYDYIKSDTQAARRIIRPGGVLIWHDYMQLLHPDVTRYLAELAAGGLQIYHLYGTTLAIHRVPNN